VIPGNDIAEGIAAVRGLSNDLNNHRDGSLSAKDGRPAVRKAPIRQEPAEMTNTNNENPADARGGQHKDPRPERLGSHMGMVHAMGSGPISLELLVWARLKGARRA